MKKIFVIAAATIFMAIPTISIFATNATPTASIILVDGTEVKVTTYNIDGYNYFKLRDIAYMLNGTEKQFDVAYNGILDSIVLTSKQSYTPVGGEMAAINSETKETSATSSKIIKDGVEIEMVAYNIDGNNYFKLRDLGEKFNFNVDYDDATHSVKLSTNDTDENISIKGVEDGDDLFTIAVPPTPMPAPTLEIS